jgi:hypothetical protein
VGGDRPGFKTELCFVEAKLGSEQYLEMGYENGFIEQCDEQFGVGRWIFKMARRATLPRKRLSRFVTRC